MKKFLSLLLVFVMILSFAACGETKPADEPRTVTGSGTMDDPWQIGATENDNVTAYLDENKWLTVEGDGAMMDFETEEDRPWNDKISDIENLSIFADLSRIGKNAFKGIGRNAEWFSAYFGTVTVFGESCFEDANLKDNTLTFEETVEALEENAFANCGADEIHFYCAPTAIAENAFTGVTAKAYVPAKNNWTDADKKGFGGELEYKNLYSFKTNDIYDTEDVSGSGEMMVPEDWELDYNADAYSSEGAFIRYEIVSGTLDIDLENPQINAYLTDDVELNVYYHYTGEEGDVEPTYESDCPFTVTRNGEPAVEGFDDGDDYCYTNGLILSGDGLTVTQSGGETPDVTVTVMKDGLTVTIDSLNLSGENTYLSALYENTTWNLVGENRFENAAYTPFFGTGSTMITGSGSLYITTTSADEAAMFLGMPAFLQSCTVLGSAEANADEADLVPVEAIPANDGGTVHFFVNGALCKTVYIQPATDD